MAIPKLKTDKNPLPHDRLHIHLSDNKDRELSSTLSDIRLKQKESITEQQAHDNGTPYVNLQQFPLTQEALLVLDRKLCEQERVICFYLSDEQVRLGAVDPKSPRIIQLAHDIEIKYRAETHIYQMSGESLKKAFERYDALPKMIVIQDEGLELSEEAIKKQQEKITSIKKINQVIAESPVSDVLTLIIGTAVKALASDIHIEAAADDIKVRMRIDGVLHEIGVLPKESWGKVIARVKLIAKLKINVTDVPQDGRFTIFIDKDKIEVRVSTVPTSYGESVVMRLLRFSLQALQFDTLGLTGYTFETLQHEIEKPNGMIITTGPTGSGKTTTLYAILNRLNNPELNILTLEDPIEYKIKGINQTQVNPQSGLTFAKGLRSLLRQDPDIIMVGEIRDLETAETAINAALTGHLMLSTLHTNSAAGALPRLLAMGAKPFLLAPSINALIGQRLVRRLCQNCKKLTPVSAETLERITKTLEPLKGRKDIIEYNLDHPEKWEFYTATGCVQCGDLGYRGRIGIFEIMYMNAELEKIILAGNVSEYEIEANGTKNGMVTMIQDGFLKVLQGVTSFEEVVKQAE